MVRPLIMALFALASTTYLVVHGGHLEAVPLLILVYVLVVTILLILRKGNTNPEGMLILAFLGITIAGFVGAISLGAMRHPWVHVLMNGAH